MDRKLGLSKEYIQYQSRQGKNGGTSLSALMLDSDTMDYEYGGAPWNDDDPDETIMQDFDDVM